MTEHKEQPVTPSINIFAHNSAGLKCIAFSPKNSMGVTLELNHQNITVYGLPVEQALGLAMLFADAYTALHLDGGTFVHLLDHMGDPDRTGPLTGFPAPTQVYRPIDMINHQSQEE